MERMEREKKSMRERGKREQAHACGKIQNASLIVVYWYEKTLSNQNN
jgi:hypothetical protein